jgi:hypothetical protein
MKNFATPSFRLRDTSFEIRLVHTLFLLLILGGLVTTWFLQFQRIGISYERVVAYYLGGEIAGQLFFAKNLNALLEETHFHAFSMSVVFLILAHLFMATSLPRGVKLVFILMTFFSHVFDPILAGFMVGLWRHDSSAALRNVVCCGIDREMKWYV